MIEDLNADCYCISLDREALRRSLDAEAGRPGFGQLVEQRCPNLFAALPVFVSRRNIDAMARVIAAVETIVALPAYRERVLAGAAPIARRDPGARGAFTGFDFHLSPSGPKLIEINTNSGGALLNVLLGRAQRACCAEVAQMLSAPPTEAVSEPGIADMFVTEWRRSHREGRPQRIAIVDDAPQDQYLYPEFVLFEHMFGRAGIEAVISAPQELSWRHGRLMHASGPVDFVYNRLTDFYLREPAHAALREAYEADAVVLTPHPHAHALYADKRNLELLSHPETLETLGAARETIAVLVDGIPRTRIVNSGNADALWAERRRLFFKPAAGYGGRAAYRGDKLTRRVWDEILQSSYVAQELVAPSQRSVDHSTALKVDLRSYTYDGKLQLLAARLYQGQTTNMRTSGGGFAPVLTQPEARESTPAACAA